MWMPANELEEMEPRQDRSRVTRRRLLASANHLLRTRPFGTLSVQEIAGGAECSIGAFYGRFRGKEELLAPLFDRHYRGVRRGLRRMMSAPGWRVMNLAERLEWITRMTVWVFRSRKWMIRALAIYVREEKGGLTEGQRTRRDEFSRSARELLADFGDEIGHADLNGAIDFALFLISTLCREKVLFGELSEREWATANDEEVISEIACAAHAYLKGAREVRGVWLGA